MENIRARAHFLVVLTPTALDRCHEVGDWLRREIEESIECKRNIVPLFVDGFDFSAPTTASHVTGKLDLLRRYNGVGVPDEYFDAAMEKLCNKFLNVPLEAVLHPASGPALEAVKEQRTAASTDVLTGLINRREFENRLQGALKRIKEHGTLYSLCYLDVDQFKIINSTYGHPAGDALLSRMGSLLKSRLGFRDTVARLGGDEFGILLEGRSLPEAMRTANSLRDAVRLNKFTWNNRSLRLGASIGVVAIPAENADVDSVLSDAESACEVAKEAGRNRIHGFEENDVDRMRRRREMQWAARINSALDEKRFELFRQSILPLQTAGADARYELILRMRDENGTVVSSESFMAAAERYGLTSSTDRWVIENAFRWLKCENGRPEKIALCSIRLSGNSLGDDEFLPFIVDQLQSTGVDATKICFAIGEAAAVARFSQASHFIERLMGFGCKFALSDFGTGTSSFGYLKHFPVDFLKIDGGFVREIIRDPIDREMVRSINEIAHLTGKETIADSAENQATIDLLRSLGVDYAQGAGVSSPEAAI